MKRHFGAGEAGDGPIKIKCCAAGKVRSTWGRASKDTQDTAETSVLFVSAEDAHAVQSNTSPRATADSPEKIHWGPVLICDPGAHAQEYPPPHQATERRHRARQNDRELFDE
ncbi:unnamed protein product [Lota lota]